MTRAELFPRCPKCGSMHVERVLRPSVRTEKDGQFTTFINEAYNRCTACAYTWDRKAYRGAGFSTEAAPKPGLLTRLSRFLAHIF